MRGRIASRHALVGAICVVWLGLGCDNGRPPFNLNPTPVTQPPAPPAPGPPPRPVPFAEPYTTIAIGDLVRHRFTESDPVCEEYPPLRCLFYRVTPSTDGVLDLNLTVLVRNPLQGLDISLRDPQFSADAWWDPVRAPVKAGVTYQITVWYGTTDVEFEMRSVLR
jgi:hypothetical protein